MQKSASLECEPSYVLLWSKTEKGKGFMSLGFGGVGGSCVEDLASQLLGGVGEGSRTCRDWKGGGAGTFSSHQKG